MRRALAGLTFAYLSARIFVFAQPAPSSGAAPLAHRWDPLGALDQILPVRALTGAMPQSSQLVQPSWDEPLQAHRPGRRTRNIHAVSFGPSPDAGSLDFSSSPGYTSALFNLQGIECPGCVFGPLPNAPFVRPPFGGDVTWEIHNDRIELFSGFGGIEAFGTNGWINPMTRKFWGASSTNGWLTQTSFGGRVAVDGGRHLWLGGSGTVIHNYGAGESNWKTFGGDATFRFGR